MQDNTETMPTATIEDRVAEYLFTDEGRVTFVFKNPQSKRFALNFKTEMLVVLNKMCGAIMHQWHKAKPEAGTFCRNAGEATVSAFEQMRGVVAIQFDSDIAYVIKNETALELADIIYKTVEKHSTPEERAAMNQKKAPLIVQPRSRIITP